MTRKEAAWIALAEKNRMKISWNSLAEYNRIRLMGMIKIRNQFSIWEAAWILQIKSKVCREALRWLILEKKIEGRFLFYFWFKPEKLERNFLDELEADYRKWAENAHEKRFKLGKKNGK